LNAFHTSCEIGH